MLGIEYNGNGPHWEASIADNQNLYFGADMDIYFSEYINGIYTTAKKLGPEINKEDEDAFCKDCKKALEHRIVTLEDPIRPDHYGGVDNPYEVFSVLEAWKLDKDFYLGNVIKYVVRAGKKDPLKRKEDLQKALVYLQKRIDSL